MTSQFIGHEEIHGRFWSKIKRGAKKRNHEFSITIQQAWDLFIKQDRKYALSGLEIKFGETTYDKTTASLDRIDSSLGYIPNNIQWVYRKINFMKHTLLEEEFIQLCRKVTQHYERS